MHCSSLVHDRLLKCQFGMILGYLQTECGCRFSSSSVSTPNFFRQNLSSCGRDWDNKHFTQPMNSFTSSIISTKEVKQKGQKGLLQLLLKYMKNSHCLHKKLDQVPRLHINIFLSTPDSAQGLLHHVTFLCRIKDVGTFYPSRDSSPLKSHLFSL